MTGRERTLAADHSLHEDIPVENILAFIGVAREHGRYPCGSRR